MRTIGEYLVNLSDEPTVLELPEGSQVVHIGLQSGEITLWIEAYKDEDIILEEYSFHIVGTGHDVPPSSEHVGTVFISEFLWHVYQEVK